MTIPFLRAILAAAAACTWTGAAHAITCYVIFDKNDNVVYRDIFPPVDMSNGGAPAREAMRRRGEYLMFVDAQRCPQVEFLTGSAGETALDFARTVPASAAATPVTGSARSATQRPPRQ